MVWLKGRFEGIMFQQNRSYFMNVCILQKKLFGKSQKVLSCVHEPDAYWFCYRENDSMEFGRFLVEKLLKPAFFNKFSKKFWEAISSIEKMYNRLEAKFLRLSAMSDKELADMYNSGLEPTFLFAAYGMTFEAAEIYLNNLLKEKLEKIAPDKIEEYFMVLSSPSKPSYVQQEKNDLIELAEKKRKKVNIEKFVTRHAKKWWFVKNNYSIQPKLGSDYFMRKINQLVKSKEKKTKIDNSKKKKILEELKDNEIRNIVKLIESLIYFHDTRKLELMKWIYYFNKMILEISKRIGLKFEDTCYMTHEEMIDLLLHKKEIDSSIIWARKRGVSIYDEKGVRVFVGKEADKWRNDIFGKVEKEVKELKGMAASPGVIKGDVIVLKSTSEARKFKKGYILVTSHTSPDWIVIMEKASAIVTERGGITSHAAIVSRELGVPCVTNIKNVTEILKDGDKVEVNGVKGTIRIL